MCILGYFLDILILAKNDKLYLLKLKLVLNFLKKQLLSGNGSVGQ